MNDMLDAVGLDHAGADDSEDPFSAIDQHLELQHLIEQTWCESCTPQEFISGDDDLPVCVEMDDETGRKPLLKS